MKEVIFSSGAVRAALGKISNVISANTVLSVMEDVKIEVGREEAIFYGSDLETTMSITVACQAMEPFVMCTPHKDLNELFKQLPECPVTLRYEETDMVLHIKSDIGKFKYGCEDPADFPGITDKKEEYKVTLQASQMSKIGIAVKFISQETLRPAMAGVCLDFRGSELHIVATDAQGMYKSEPITLEKEHKAEVVISQKAVKALMALGYTTPTEITLLGTDSHISFKNNDTTLYTRLIDAKFPDYNAVIPKYEHNFCVDLPLLNSRLKLVGLVANKTTSAVNFEITTDNNLVLTSGDIDFNRDGTTSVTIAEKNCEEFKFALNYKLFERISSNLSKEVIFWNAQSPTRAFLFQDKETKDTYLLMPLMVGV